MPPCVHTSPGGGVPEGWMWRTTRARGLFCRPFAAVHIYDMYNKAIRPRGWFHVSEAPVMENRPKPLTGPVIPPLFGLVVVA